MDCLSTLLDSRRTANNKFNTEDLVRCDERCERMRGVASRTVPTVYPLSLETQNAARERQAREMHVSNFNFPCTCLSLSDTVHYLLLTSAQCTTFTAGRDKDWSRGDRPLALTVRAVIRTAVVPTVDSGRRVCLTVTEMTIHTTPYMSKDGADGPC
jgi:hypothetical protein